MLALKIYSRRLELQAVDEIAESFGLEPHTEVDSVLGIQPGSFLEA